MNYIIAAVLIGFPSTAIYFNYLDKSTDVSENVKDSLILAVVICLLIKAFES